MSTGDMTLASGRLPKWIVPPWWKAYWRYDRDSTSHVRVDRLRADDTFWPGKWSSKRLPRRTTTSWRCSVRGRLPRPTSAPKLNPNHVPSFDH
jgi:hypothetical protein